MKLILDESFIELGIKNIVAARVYNISSTLTLDDKFINKLKAKEKEILELDYERVKNNPIIEGYRKLIENVKRSVKKNPPTVESFIENIKRRGQIPRINSIVDVYNLASLNSYLSIGGHDLDKVTGNIYFTKSKVEDTFYPISAPSKHVEPTDFLYKDDKGIMAYLGIRDGEAYKIDENTKNVIFIIAGNANTDVESRKEVLINLCEELKKYNKDLTYEIEVV